MHFFYIIMSSFSFSAESRSRLSMWEISGMVGRGVLKGLNKRVTERLVFFGNVARFHHYQANSKQEHWTPRTVVPLRIWIFVVSYPVSKQRHRHLLIPPATPKKLDDFQRWKRGATGGHLEVPTDHSTLVNYSGTCINHHYSTDQEVDSPAVGKRFHQQPPQ